MLKDKGALLTLNGIDYHLRITVNVIEDAEEQFGMDINKIIKTFIKDYDTASINYSNLCKFVLLLVNESVEIQNEEGASLKPLTLKQLKRYVDNSNVAEVFTKTLEAFNLSFMNSDDKRPS